MSYPHYPSTQIPASSYQSDLTMDMNIQQRRQISQPAPPILPINTAVIAHYHDAVWCAGVVQTYTIHPNCVIEYRIVFHSGDTRLVSAGKVLHEKGAKQQIMIGSRVVVEHPIRPLYMSALVAEIPTENNMFRYLMFLDDGSSVYKMEEKLWVVGLMDNPIDCLPSNYKMFIQKYFVDIRNIKICRYGIGDTISVSFINNVLMHSVGKILQIDCNIMLVQYSSSRDMEWLYQGSNRVIQPQESKESSVITVHDSPDKAFPIRNNSIAAFNHQPASVTLSSSYNPLPPVLDTSISRPGFTTPKRYIKSPLKSKGLMLSPQLDPFVFSDEEPTTINRMSFDHYVTPVAPEQYDIDPITPNSVSDVCSNQRLVGSPILIIDSPEKRQRNNQQNIPIPITHTSGNSTSFNQSLFQQQQSSNNANSVPNITIDSKAPSSFFTWSSPGVSEQASPSKEVSPRVNIEFDIEDTILTQEDTILSQNTATRNLFSTTPPHCLQAVITPIEIVDDTHIESKDDVKPLNGSQAFPIIIHQEACEVDDSDSLPAIVTQNGNMIELVVESDVGNTIISVATPPVKTEIPITPDDVIQPKVTRSSSGSLKPGKRRLLTPTKNLKPVPKIRIELDNTNNNQPTIIKRECSVQKAEKKSKRQQTKDIRERQTKNFLSENKKDNPEKNSDNNVVIKPKPAPKIKLKDIDYPSFVVKKEPIKLNSEAKISRWNVPWAKKICGHSRQDHSEEQNLTLLSNMLTKLEDVEQEEELEEGEIDSESEEDQVVTKSENDHVCSIMCIKVVTSVFSNVSPLCYPLERGWRRVIGADEESLHYVTPCGKVKRDLSEIQTYFTSIGSFPLSINNFCFNPAMKLLDGSGELDESSEFYSPDISNGLEFVTVPLNSDVALLPTDHFKYIIDRIFEIKPLTCHLEMSCNCTDNCQSNLCQCQNRSVTKVISECNNFCGCNLNCKNRVTQQGLRQLLQVRKENDVCRVFTLHDIPQGSFICSIMGKVKKCPGNLSKFIFPLDQSLYKEDDNTDSPVKELKESFEPRLYHHSDNTIVSNYQLKSETSSYRRSMEFLSQPYNAIWVSVLSKHTRLKTTDFDDVSMAFPSILLKRQTKAVTLKPSSSDKKAQTTTEYCIDCSQFGNVSRFLRSGSEYNLVIRPILVDNQTIPWLALFSIKDIFLGSELVYKDFPH